MLFGLALAAAIQMASCQTIQTDHIYGRDLAAALPAFSKLAPDQPLSLSPIPGQKRVFHAGELTRIARANGIMGNITEGTCFEWNTRVPGREELLAAMKATLANESTTVELVDQSLVPVPKGVVEFPISGLSGASDGPVVWRGTVTYAPNRNVPIWARVRIVVHEKQVVAAETLRPGEPIRPVQLRTEDYAGPFRREKKFTDPQQVIGLMPRNTITPGTVLGSGLVREISDVERGDTVQVVVQFGPTRIEAQGIAEEGGARGTVITVRNAKSGRKFRARIEDRDKVLVLPTGGAGLAVEETKS